MSDKPIVNIPKPCREDWAGMSPAGKGRFCDSCSKIVVDFTHMSNTEILQYFRESGDQRVCGRFTSRQVTPQAKVSRHEFFKRPFQKTAAILVAGFTLLVSACRPNTVGEAKMGKPMPPETAVTIDSSVKADQHDPKEKQPEEMKETKPHEPVFHVPGEPMGLMTIIGDTVIMPDTMKNLPEIPEK